VTIDPQDPDRTAALFGRALASCLDQGSHDGRSERAEFAIARYSWPRAAGRYAEILERLHSSRGARVGTASPPRNASALHKKGG
jgi:hypothetical protein